MTAASMGRGLSVDLHLVVGQFPGMTAAQALRDAVEHAVAAEAAGFDAVWIAEHHFLTYGVCPSATALSAHVLAATSSVGIGAAGAILADRHPVSLGEEAAMLGELTGGRFRLGVAPGGPWVDREVFAPPGRPPASFVESLDLLSRWLSGEPAVDADGTHFRFPPVAVVPRPCTPVPLHVCATSAAVAEVAAQRGLPLLAGLQASAAQVRNLIRHHVKTAAAHGHDPAALMHGASRLAQVDDNDVAARTALRESLPRWLASRTTAARAVPGQRQRDPAAYAQRLIAEHAVGSSDHVVERLAEFVQSSGVRRLLLVVEAAGQTDRTRRNIDMLGAHVLPALRRLVSRVQPNSLNSHTI